MPERRTATFRPVEPRPEGVDQLPPEAEEWIGRTLLWQNMGAVDHGVEEGEVYWMPVGGYDGPPPPLVHVAERDLEFAE